VNHLRQLGQWGILYADNWAGVLPTNGNRYPQISGTRWYEKNPEWKSKAREGTVLHCPAARVMQPRWIWPGSCDNDYGLNSYLGGREWGPNIPSVRYLTSEKYWWGDGMFGTYNGMYYCWENMNCVPVGLKYLPWMWYYPVFEGHPGDRANFVFGDGHVESRSLEQINALSGDALNRWTGTKTQ
jgi:prepilin-type processing-associated H-X9-DG protein